MKLIDWLVGSLFWRFFRHLPIANKKRAAYHWLLLAIFFEILFNTKDVFLAETMFRLDKMFHFTAVLFLYPYLTRQHQHHVQGNPGLKRTGFHQGVSYANFAVHTFQHLQGSPLGSSCEVVEVEDCAFACVDNPPCFSFNIALLPNENGKLRCELLSEDMFRSRSKLTVSQKFHHYSIQVILKII